MSTNLDAAKKQLASRLPCGYASETTTATEPTALACLALAALDDLTAAGPGLNWLAKQQAADGSLGISQNQPSPWWPTSLAILAWLRDRERFAGPIEHAVAWLLKDHGKSLPKSPYMGHDSRLVGWSWAANTHSWMEPTAWSVMALKATGHGNHPRTREAVTLMIDRLLPEGGCNYGNTFVLGQELRAHVQPTGLTVLALADEKVSDPRLARSVDFLQREVSPRTTIASLCYALLGLGAYGRIPAAAHEWLAEGIDRLLAKPDPLRLALACLAARATSSPLLPAVPEATSRLGKG